MTRRGIFALTIMLHLLCAAIAVGQPNLETPQAAVEHFIEHARDEGFQQASLALDTRLLRDLSPSEAAEQLYFVMTQELWIDWSMLPDRADGMIDSPGIGGDNAMVGKERISIPLGDIKANGWSVPIRVDRIEDAKGDLRFVAVPIG